MAKKSSKDRIMQAAVDLFLEKGISETTTKAIAEHAQVNEVTLFRNFGNKHGLLLAITQDWQLLSKLAQDLVRQTGSQLGLAEGIKKYSEVSLEHLERLSAFVHSLFAEISSYNSAERLLFSRALGQANSYIAKYLELLIKNESVTSNIPPEKLAGLLHSLLLGYFALQSMSQKQLCWLDRADFLASLVELFVSGAIKPDKPVNLGKIKQETEEKIIIRDLSANLSKIILQRAKKQGKLAYAVIFTLFAAGLSPREIVALERSHYIFEPPQHILQINSGAIRQVPLNQWILGKRYGFDNSNPLTQYLKTRKDTSSALFLNSQAQPLSELDLISLWQKLTHDLLTPHNQPPSIEQVQATWCVEMICKGMELKNLSILSGKSLVELEAFAQRAKEKMAIEQAYMLDKKPS